MFAGKVGPSTILQNLAPESNSEESVQGVPSLEHDGRKKSTATPPLALNVAINDVELTLSATSS